MPGTVICTAFPASDYKAYAEQGAPFLQGIREFRRLEFVDLHTGHWPMWSRPDELAAAISAAAGAPAGGEAQPSR